MSGIINPSGGFIRRLFQSSTDIRTPPERVIIQSKEKQITTKVYWEAKRKGKSRFWPKVLLKSASSPSPHLPHGPRFQMRTNIKWNTSRENCFINFEFKFPPSWSFSYLKGQISKYEGTLGYLLNTSSNFPLKKSNNSKSLRDVGISHFLIKLTNWKKDFFWKFSSAFRERRNGTELWNFSFHWFFTNFFFFNQIWFSDVIHAIIYNWSEFHVLS